LAPDAIERTLVYFNDPKTFAVCGFVIPQKIETLWERGRHIEYVFGITLMKGAQNNTGLIMVASGCFTLFRTKVLKQLGLFNERTMAEDMDLTWEALFRGYKVYCEQEAVCYPLDPSTMEVYYKQLRRWYSGFLQNISVHKKDLVRFWQFGLLFIYYLAEAVIFPVAALLICIMFASMWKMILAISGLQVLMVVIPTLYKGWRLGYFWKTLSSFPAYYLTRPVNIAALYATIYNEWIIGKRLAVWDKGH
jgi:biofilm PGA synthesis N-glycosyltransferase PgaC